MTLVQHHTKYKEIHGIDEIIMITESEHKKLHIRLRKEGKCNISVDELKNISNKAEKRSRQQIRFVEAVGKNVNLFEVIEYYPYSGKIYISSHFIGNHGYKLPVINLK